MGISEIIEALVSFWRAHTAIAIVAGLLLFIFMVRRPKLFFFTLGLVAILALIYYFIMTFAATGVSEKKKMLEKGEPTEIQYQLKGCLKL